MVISKRLSRLNEFLFEPFFSRIIKNNSKNHKEVYKYNPELEFHRIIVSERRKKRNVRNSSNVSEKLWIPVKSKLK